MDYRKFAIYPKDSAQPWYSTWATSIYLHNYKVGVEIVLAITITIFARVRVGIEISKAIEINFTPTKHTYPSPLTFVRKPCQTKSYLACKKADITSSRSIPYGFLKFVSEASFHKAEGGKSPLIFHTSHDLNYNNLSNLMKLSFIASNVLILRFCHIKLSVHDVPLPM